MPRPGGTPHLSQFCMLYMQAQPPTKQTCLQKERALTHPSKIAMHPKSLSSLIKKWMNESVGAKKNHPTLQKEVALFFEDKSLPKKQETVADKSHDRLEQRTCHSNDQMDWLRQHHSFPELRSILCIESSRELHGQVQTEQRHRMSILHPNCRRMLHLKRPSAHLVQHKNQTEPSVDAKSAGVEQLLSPRYFACPFLMNCPWIQRSFLDKINALAYSSRRSSFLSVVRL